MTRRPAAPADDQDLSPELGRCMAETFAAMGDPNRALILLHLSRGERCVSDLAGLLGISESAVSQHLRLLRTLRLVYSRKEGRRVFYNLDDHHVFALLEICREHVEGDKRSAPG